MAKKYTMGFDPWVPVLFCAIMLPNIIWAFLPAPDDILRTPSVTPAVDAAGSVLQVLMIAALCMLRSAEDIQNGPPLLLWGTGLCTAVYWLSWVLYYLGQTGAPVIAGLTLPPCLAFVLFALWRRHLPGLAAAGGFTLCHVIFALVNFII